MRLVRRSSGLYVPRTNRRQRYSRPTVIDFFCGAGGFSCGFVQAGFQVVAAVDWDMDAIITYAVNLGAYPIRFHFTEPGGKEKFEKRLDKLMGLNKKDKTIKRAFTAGSGWIAGQDCPGCEHIWVGDIRKITGEMILDAIGMKVGEVDAVIGGPPCQGFSQAGKQNIADPRNNLVYEFGRLITEIQPRSFVMEEVPAILNFFDPDGMLVLDKFAMIVSKGGYGSFDNVRKSMFMQSGCVIPKSGTRGNKKLPKNREATTTQKDDQEQLSLF